MFNVIATGNNATYGVRQFVVDKATDISSLPTNVPMGSTAFVIADSTTYMLNSEGAWIKVQITSGGGDTPTPGPTTIIYDGGRPQGWEEGK